MSDIVNAFRQNVSGNVANASKRKKKTNEGEVVASNNSISNRLTEDNKTNSALEASRKTNVEQNVYAAQQLKAKQAAEQQAQQQSQQVAQQQSQQVAQQQSQQVAQQTPQTTQQIDEGWKKYYDDAFKKETSNMGFFDKLLDNGQASKRAETIAKTKYATELMNNNEQEKAKSVASNAVQVAKQNQAQGRAIGNAIGANKDTAYTNESLWGKLRNTTNALSRLDFASGLLGAQDTVNSNMIDKAARFVVNLPMGTFTATPQGIKKVSEALYGYGTDEETGLDRNLNWWERAGRALEGGIDIASPFIGGEAGASKLLKNASDSTLKQVGKAILNSAIDEGKEEAIQQVGSYFGNLEKLDDFDLSDLGSQVIQSGVLGAVGGGIMAGGAAATNAGVNAIKNKVNTKTNTKIDTQQSVDPNTVINENIDTVEKLGNVNENVQEDVKAVEEGNVTEEAKTNPEETLNIQQQEQLKTTTTDPVVQKKLDITDRITKLNNDAANTRVKDDIKFVNDSIVNEINNGEITIEQAEKMLLDAENYLNEVKAETTPAVDTETLQASNIQEDTNATTTPSDTVTTVPNEQITQNTQDNTQVEAEGMNAPIETTELTLDDLKGRTIQDIIESGDWERIQDRDLRKAIIKKYAQGVNNELNAQDIERYRQLWKTNPDFAARMNIPNPDGVVFNGPRKEGYTYETTIWPEDVQNKTALDDMAKMAGFYDENVETTGPTVEQPTAQPTRNTYQQQIEQRSAEINSKLQETGMTPELLKKIADERLRANRAVEQPNLDAVLDANEQKIAHDYFNAKAGGDGTDMYNSAFVTMQKAGTDYNGRAADEFFNTGKLSNIYTNYQAILETADADMSGKADADWVLRNENPELFIKNDIANSLQDIAPDATADTISKSTETIYKAQSDLNNSATKVSNAIENGKVKDAAQVFTQKNVKKAKVFAAYQKIGADLGIQTTIDTKASGLTTDAKLKSINQWNSGYCFEMKTNEGAYIRTDTETMVNDIKNNLKNITPAQVDAIAKGADEKIAFYTDKFGDKQVATEYVNKKIFDACWRENAKNTAMRTTFTDAKANETVEWAYNYTTLKDNVEMTNGDKVASMVAGAMNSSMRGFKWMTTIRELAEATKIFRDFGPLKIPSFAEMDTILANHGQKGYSLQSMIDNLPKAERAKVQEKVNAYYSKMATVDGDAKVTLMTKMLNDIYPIVKKVNGLGQWNAYVQTFKDATYLYNADLYWSNKLGLDANSLEVRRAALNDFDNNMLPQDQMFKIIKNSCAKASPFTLYMDSSLRLFQKEFRTMTGGNTAGIYSDINSRAAKIGLNAATDVLPKMIFAMMTGSSYLAVAGIPQWTDDYTGISDEDKNMLDKLVNIVGNINPILGVGKTWYFNKRKADIAAEEGEEVDWVKKSLAETQKMFTPFGGKIDELAKSAELDSKGYSENASERVQYLNPDNIVDWARMALEGKGATSNAREYNNNPDFLYALQTGDWESFFKDNNAYKDFAELVGLRSEEDYNRPASASESANYNEKIKTTTGEEQQDWYNKSREYNAITDKLRVENNDAYQVYIDQYSNSYVSPERWRKVAYGTSTDGQPDLTVWNTMKDLAVQRSKDFGTDLDPAYTLDDERARRYLEYKSTPTGEDILLKKDMVIDPFWEEFFAEQKTYYANNSSEYDDAEKDQRVKEWNDWNTRYSNMYKWNEDTEESYQLRLKYPTMAAYNSLKAALEENYGDSYKNTTEYKNFWNTYGDAYSEESDEYNKEMLYIINQMRAIEGYDPMTIDQLEETNSFGKSSSYSSGGSGSSSSYSYVPTFENIFQASAMSFKNYGSNKKVKPNLAGSASFYSIPMSEASGTNAYHAE